MAPISRLWPRGPGRKFETIDVTLTQVFPSLAAKTNGLIAALTDCSM